MSSLPHNLHLIDSTSVDVGISSKVDRPRRHRQRTVALPAGTYQVICTIAGHGNMKATLTVK